MQKSKSQPALFAPWPTAITSNISQHLESGLPKWRRLDRELLWPRKQASTLRHRPIKQITADDVQERVEALRDRRKREAARQLFEGVRALFKLAKKQRCYGLRDLPTDRDRSNAIIGKENKTQVYFVE